MTDHADATDARPPQGASAAPDAAPMLSIVIPAYNEAERLPTTLRAVLRWLEGYGGPWEVIVADDGSTDGTVERVRAEFPQVRVLQAPRNEGKGGAVRRGMLAARGDLRLFTDADLSTPIEELDGMLRVWRERGCDIVIASRALPQSRLIVRQPWWRECAGRMFNRLVRPLSGLPYEDTQCGFKLFTRRAAECVFPRQRSTRWAFDVELLMLARVHGLRVDEHPVRWINDTASKVRLTRDAPRMLADVIRFRWRHFMGEMARDATPETSSPPASDHRDAR